LNYEKQIQVVSQDKLYLNSSTAIAIANITNITDIDAQNLFIKLYMS